MGKLLDRWESVMALKKIDLAEIDMRHMPGMTLEEYREELKKPRAERQGLKPVPKDMSISTEDAEFIKKAMLKHHKQSSAEKARAIAHGMNSNVR